MRDAPALRSFQAGGFAIGKPVVRDDGCLQPDSLYHENQAHRAFSRRVPLKKEIKHASHSRTESENLVVRVELANGQAGYGEGVPRAT